MADGFQQAVTLIGLGIPGLIPEILQLVKSLRDQGVEQYVAANHQIEQKDNLHVPGVGLDVSRPVIESEHLEPRDEGVLEGVGLQADNQHDEHDEEHQDQEEGGVDLLENFLDFEPQVEDLSDKEDPGAVEQKGGLAVLVDQGEGDQDLQEYSGGGEFPKDVSRRGFEKDDTESGYHAKGIVHPSEMRLEGEDEPYSCTQNIYLPEDVSLRIQIDSYIFKSGQQQLPQMVAELLDVNVLQDQSLVDVVQDLEDQHCGHQYSKGGHQT